MFFSIFYFCVLQKYQISKIIALQLLIELIVTGMAYNGFEHTGSVSIAIIAGKASFMGLAMLPMLVELTQLIPGSVESTLASLHFACLNFSFDWGGKFMTAIMFGILGVGEDMKKIDTAVEYKIFMLIAFLLLTFLLPSSEEMAEASKKLDTKVSEINKCYSESRSINEGGYEDRINL